MTTNPASPRRDHRAEWITSLGRVQAWCEENGRLPRQRDRSGDTPVGKWLARQREKFTTLSAEQQQALNQLPGFSVAQRSHDWDTMLALTIEFHADTGRWPEATYEHADTHDGAPVGQWLKDCLRGRHEMTPARIAALRTARIL